MVLRFIRRHFALETLRGGREELGQKRAERGNEVHPTTDVVYKMKWLSRGWNGALDGFLRRSTFSA